MDLPGCHSRRMPARRTPSWSSTPYCVPYWSPEALPERDRGLCEGCEHRYYVPYEGE